MKRILTAIVFLFLYTHGTCQVNNSKSDSATAMQADSMRMMDTLMKYMDTNMIRNAMNKLDSLFRDSVYNTYLNAYQDSVYAHDSLLAPGDSVLMNSFMKAIGSMDSAYKNIGAVALDSMSKLADDSVYNSDGKLSLIKFNGLDKLMGLSYEKFDYNRKGDMVRSTYYNDKNEVVPGFAGIAITEYKYDKAHNCTEEHYLDKNGKPMNDKLFGVSIIKNKYNKQNQIIESDYFDSDGTPIPSYAKSVYQYDDSGQVSNTINYDSQGNVVR